MALHLGSWPDLFHGSGFCSTETGSLPKVNKVTRVSGVFSHVEVNAPEIAMEINLKGKETILLKQKTIVGRATLYRRDDLVRFDCESDSHEHIDVEGREVELPHDDYERGVKLPDRILHRCFTESPTNSILSVEDQDLGGMMFLYQPFTDPFFPILEKVTDGDATDGDVGQKRIRKEELHNDGSITITETTEITNGVAIMSYIEKDSEGNMMHASSFMTSDGLEGALHIYEETRTYASGFPSARERFLQTHDPLGNPLVTVRTTIDYDLSSVSAEAIPEETFSFEAIGADVEAEGVIDYRLNPPLAHMYTPEERNADDTDGLLAPLEVAGEHERPPFRERNVTRAGEPAAESEGGGLDVRVVAIVSGLCLVAGVSLFGLRRLRRKERMGRFQP